MAIEDLGSVVYGRDEHHALVTGQLDWHVIEAQDSALLIAVAWPDGPDLAGRAELVVALVIGADDPGERHAVRRFAVRCHRSSPCRLKGWTIPALPGPIRTATGRPVMANTDFWSGQAIDQERPARPAGVRARPVCKLEWADQHFRSGKET